MELLILLFFLKKKDRQWYSGSHAGIEMLVCGVSGDRTASLLTG